MKEFYSVEQINAVPSVEIARNLARVARLDLALDENSQTDGRSHGDFGSDSEQMLYYMEKAARNLSDLSADSSYDYGVVYALQRYSFQDAVTRLPDEIEAIAREPKVTRDTVLRTLAVDGYERVGDIFERQRQKLIPKIGAYAAMAYNRADIRSEMDRSLYERAGEIDAARDAIELAVPRRGIRYYFDTGPVTTIDVSVFKYFERQASTDWWWRELKTDQTAIDAAAEAIR